MTRRQVGTIVAMFMAGCAARQPPPHAHAMAGMNGNMACKPGMMQGAAKTGDEHAGHSPAPAPAGDEHAAHAPQP